MKRFDILRAEDEATLLLNRRNANGDAGAAWVGDLPRLVVQAAEQWSLTLEPHYPDLSYNYVTPVRLPDSEPAVLKLCFPGEDFRHEEAALRAFAGEACVRLRASNLEAGALLLDRVMPGTPLSDLKDGSAEVAVAAAVMRKLQRPATDHPFPSIEDWLRKVAEKAGQSERPPGWLESGLALGRQLLAGSTVPQVLLHGDLHHANILAAGDSWIAIDPQGVLGERAWEIGPFLYNNLPGDAGETAWRRIIRRRAERFSEALALDSHRVMACGAVFAVMSAAWDIDFIEDRPTSFAIHRAVMQELGGF